MALRKEEVAQRVQREFGENVRRLRLAAGLSQAELAFRADLHPTYVSGIERGLRNLSLVNIHELARALGTGPAVFFSDST